jgi:hypothetical protein
MNIELNLKNSELLARLSKVFRFTPDSIVNQVLEDLLSEMINNADIETMFHHLGSPFYPTAEEAEAVCASLHELDDAEIEKGNRRYRQKFVLQRALGGWAIELGEIEKVSVREHAIA